MTCNRNVGTICLYVSRSTSAARDYLVGVHCFNLVVVLESVPHHEWDLRSPLYTSGLLHYSIKYFLTKRDCFFIGAETLRVVPFTLNSREKSLSMEDSIFRWA